jgi:hypothetical protein
LFAAYDSTQPPRFTPEYLLNKHAVLWAPIVILAIAGLSSYVHYRRHAAPVDESFAGNDSTAITARSSDFHKESAKDDTLARFSLNSVRVAAFELVLALVSGLGLYPDSHRGDNEIAYVVTSGRWSVFILYALALAFYGADVAARKLWIALSERPSFPRFLKAVLITIGLAGLVTLTATSSPNNPGELAGGTVTAVAAMFPFFTIAALLTGAGLLIQAAKRAFARKPVAIGTQ